MALTDTFVRQVKHTGKASGDKHADGGGMYLLVKAGGRYWRMDYTHASKRKTLALTLTTCRIAPGFVSPIWSETPSTRPVPPRSLSAQPHSGAWSQAKNSRSPPSCPRE